MSRSLDERFHALQLALTERMTSRLKGTNFIAARSASDARFKSEKCLLCQGRVKAGQTALCNEKVPGWIHVACLYTAAGILAEVEAPISKSEWQGQEVKPEIEENREQISELGFFGWLDKMANQRRAEKAAAGKPARSSGYADIINIRRSV